MWALSELYYWTLMGKKASTFTLFYFRKNEKVISWLYAVVMVHESYSGLARDEFFW